MKINKGKFDKMEFPSKGPRKNFKKYKPQKGTLISKHFASSCKRLAAGHGATLPQKTFSYFVGILPALKRPDMAPEEYALMADKVLTVADGQEIECSSNVMASRVFECILPYSDPERFEKFMNAIAEDFRRSCTDVYCSFVIQKILEIAFLRAVGDNPNNETVETTIPKKVDPHVSYNLTTEFPKSHKNACSEFMQRCSKFLLNNLDEFVTVMITSNLIATCILYLSGVFFQKSNLEGGFTRFFSLFNESKKTYRIPSEWSDIMREFPSRLQKWPHFGDLPYSKPAALVLQAICVAYAHLDNKQFTAFGKKLLKEGLLKEHTTIKSEEEQKNGTEEGEQENENNIQESAAENLPSVFKYESSGWVLETLMVTANDKLQKEIYKSIFENRITEFATTRASNFAVQKLVMVNRDKALFETFVDELCEHMPQILQSGHSGVVGRLFESAVRFNAKQSVLITSLMDAFNCSAKFGPDRPKSFFLCLLKLKPFEAIPFEIKTRYVSELGSRIIQNILEFNKPIFMVNCILETPVKQLVDAISTRSGSFICKQFLKSKSIGEKSREKFIKLFENFYIDIVLSPCGSYVLEEMFSLSNEAQKVKIARELCMKKNKLKSSSGGRYIYNVFHLGIFEISVDKWKAAIAGKIKVEGAQKSPKVNQQSPVKSENGTPSKENVSKKAQSVRSTAVKKEENSDNEDDDEQQGEDEESHMEVEAEEEEDEDDDEIESEEDTSDSDEAPTLVNKNINEEDDDETDEDEEVDKDDEEVDEDDEEDEEVDDDDEEDEEVDEDDEDDEDEEEESDDSDNEEDVVPSKKQKISPENSIKGGKTPAKVSKTPVKPQHTPVAPGKGPTKILKTPNTGTPRKAKTPGNVEKSPNKNNSYQFNKSGSKPNDISEKTPNKFGKKQGHVGKTPNKRTPGMKR